MNTGKIISAAWAVCSLALVVLYLAPIFATPNALINDNPYKYHDYLQQATYDFLFRQGVVEHHQFPLRTHMLGGGYPIIANPQDTSFSPFVITTLIFGEVTGMKINLVLFFLIGAAGILLLVKKGLNLPWQGAVFAALAYTFSSWWASRVIWGFYFKFYFHLFPLLFYLYIKACKDTRYLVLCAMVLFVVISQLGLGFVVIFLFLFCFELADYLARIKKSKSPVFLWRLALLGFLVIGLAAVRILPMAELVVENPRSIGEYESYVQIPHAYPNFYQGFSHLAKALTMDSPIPNYPINPGYGVLLLALVGAVLAIRKSWPYLVMLILFTWFAMGPYAPVDIWRFVFHVPMFSSMHQPYQLTNYFMLFSLVILAAYGFVPIENLPSKKSRLLLGLVSLLFLIQPWLVNRTAYETTFTKPAPELKIEKRFYQVQGKNMNRGAPRSLYSQQYFNVKRNVGTIDWDGDVLLPENAEGKMFVDADDMQTPNSAYRAEAYLLEEEGKATLLKLSPNRIEVAVSCPKDCVLIINQNYDPSWVETHKLMVESRGGLLAVRVGSNTNKVRLAYRPMLFFIGLGISILFWIGSIRFLIGPGRSSRMAI